MSGRSSAVAVVLSGLLCASRALGDPVVSTQAPPLTLAGDPSLVVQSAGARGDGVLRFSLAAEYAREPLVVLNEEQAIYRVVVEQLWVHPSVSLALSHRFFVGLELPLLAFESGEPPPPRTSEALPDASGFALGDPRLLVRARLLGAPDAFHAGAGAELFVPIGGGSYAGDGSVRARPFVAAGVEEERYFLSFDAGYLLREGRTLPGVLPTRVGSALTAGAAVGVALDRPGWFSLGPELEGSFVVGEGASLFDPRSTLVTLLAHARYRIRGGPLEISAAFGPSLGQAPGASDYRAIFGIAFSPEEPPPPPDGDADSVPDEHDMCPSLKGVPSGDPLMHGCPELPSDTDGDGIPDIYDACPQTAGEATGFRQTHGCPPAPDTDRDGISDPEDACFDLPGVAHSDKKLNGCPPAAPKAELVERKIEISQEIQFETGTAVLRTDSDVILEELARLLKERPDLAHVEVAGHTDDTGTPELNQRLSLERAERVVVWLVAHGIAPERLEPKGYGQTRPVADNTRPEGRARNRRVEFHVLEVRGGGTSP